MIPISAAVDMLFHGRSNVIKAAEACGESPETLKQLLLEKVHSKPQLEPLQLTLNLK
jgi:hypothetical protein